jgi:serine/threonine-protein kinase RsbT
MTWTGEEVPPNAITVELRVTADVAVAGVVARRVAGQGGMGSTGAAEVATVAAELAANAIRHGGGGELRVWLSDERLHLLVCDRGHVHFASCSERVLRATAPDAEHGLGAVRRFMHHVELVDTPGGGLCVLAWRAREGAERR